MSGLDELSLTAALDLHDQNKLHGFFKMSDQDYRDSPGLNQSSLKHMLKCPAAYKISVGQNGSKKTKAMEVGSLVHLLLLQGQEEFDRVICQPPNDNPRTKIYKDFVAEQQKLGKIVATSQDCEVIFGIQKSAKDNSVVQKALSGGMPEIVAFAKHRSGVLLKGKVDYARQDTVFDLKTTESADEKSFSKSCRQYMYDFQGAYYVDLMNLAAGRHRFKRFAILAVEKRPPYLFNYFLMSDKDMDRARANYEMCISEYISCTTKGEWPGYGDDWKMLNLWG